MKEQKNMYNTEKKDTLKSLAEKFKAAQMAGDYEAAEMYDKQIKDLRSHENNKTSRDKNSISELDKESKKAQTAGDYERAQELEEMKKKHKENAEYTAKIEDLNESEKESLPPGGFRAEEDNKGTKVEADSEQKAAVTAAKVEAVKVDIIEKLKLDTTNKSPLWAKNLGSSGLKVSDLENVPEFVKLSTGEQLLVLEEINQRNARKMQELTKDRYDAKMAGSRNKVLDYVSDKVANTELGKELGKTKFGKAMGKISTALGGITIGNMWRGLTKNFQKASIEKKVAGEIRGGSHNVDIATIKQISERIKELGLSVNEKTGEVMFLKEQGDDISRGMTAAQIKKYNDVANAYMKLPTDWQHEKTANKNILNPFKSNEYKQFEKIDAEYKGIRSAIMASLEKYGLEQKMSPKDARLNAQKLMSKTELGFDYLNYTRKYPEAAALLESSAVQNQYKKLLTGDAATFLMGGAIGSIFKGVSGPIGGGAIFGGIRGFFTGKKTVKDQYKSDQTDLTHKEAKELGMTKKESIDRFINADDQVTKIKKLIEKLGKAETEQEKFIIAQRIKSRLDYIEHKGYKGFINYGKNDDIAKNFELNKTIAAGSAAMMMFTGGKELKEGIEAQYNETRIKQFAEYINNRQSSKYENERAKIVVGAVIRGAAIGAVGATFGHYLNNWMHSGDGIPTPGPVPTPEVGHSLDVTIDKGQGMIHFAGQLKHAVTEKWGSDMSNAPESVKHIMNTSSEDLAKEFGGFKPGQINESAMLNKGANFHMDNQGNLTFKDPVTGESDLFEFGKSADKGAEDYHGKMFDYKGSHVNSIPRGAPLNSIEPGAAGNNAPIQIDPTTGDQALELKTGNSQIDPTTGNHNTGLENTTIGTDPFKGFNSVAKIHEVQNAQLADLKNQLGEKDYTKLMTDLKTKGIQYESDGKTLRAISIGKSTDIEFAEQIARGNTSGELLQQTGLRELKLTPAYTYIESIKLSDGQYAKIVVVEAHAVNGHEVSEIISQPHAVSNPDALTPTGASSTQEAIKIKSNPDELNPAGPASKTAETLADTKINTAAEGAVAQKIHSGFSNAAKAFPMEEKVAGLSREQFDKIALHEIKADLNLDANTELIETPDIGHRLWMYENFGTISQASDAQNSWDMTPPDVNLGKIKNLSDFMFKNPNDSITLAIKNLESRVMSATGKNVYEMPSMIGVNAEKYTKNLIAELYK